MQSLIRRLANPLSYVEAPRQDTWVSWSFLKVRKRNCKRARWVQVEVASFSFQVLLKLTLASWKGDTW
jgi:hypothetical protein